MKISKFIFNSAKTYKNYLIGQLLCAIYIGIDLAFKPYIFKLIIDALMGGKNPIFSNINSIICFYCVLQTLMFLVWRIYYWCNLSYEPLLKNSITRYFLFSLLNYPYDYFEKHLPGSIVSFIKDAASTVPLIINIIFSYTKNIVLLLCSFFILWTLHPVFSILIFLWAVFFIGVAVFTRKSFYDTNFNSATQSAQVINIILNTLNNILPIRFSATETLELKKLDVQQEKYCMASGQKKSLLLKIYCFQGGFVIIHQILCVLFLFYFYKIKIITLGDFTLVLAVNISLMMSFWQMSDDIRMLNEHSSVLSKSLNVLKLKKPLPLIESASNIALEHYEITFDKINFSYSTERPLLVNQSLTILPKQKIGIVGYSGSGKSTFTKLLLKLYKVQEGAIYIDGHNILDINNIIFRKIISVVPQVVTTFNDTIIENIRYANHEATMADVIEVSKKLHLHDFIMSLPLQYNSRIGEGGIQVSSGEKQKIVIARAILKDAKILILDEHTSHLDSIAEATIQKVLDDYMRDKTTIIVAHRLSILMKMDRILVFEKGRVIQDGNHEELLKQNGLYKDLWLEQSNNYKN